ncbi:hypothetical protein D3C76_1573650 [compost metagenome]
MLKLIRCLLLRIQFTEPAQILMHHRAVKFRMELGRQHTIAITEDLIGILLRPGQRHCAGGGRQHALRVDQIGLEARR